MIIAARIVLCIVFNQKLVCCSRRLRLLITGGCGYFGFKLAKTLHTLGAQVTILDLQLTPKIEKVLDRNLKFIKVRCVAFLPLLAVFQLCALFFFTCMIFVNIYSFLCHTTFKDFENKNVFTKPNHSSIVS